jgi:MscS family membrane protein
LPPPVTTTIRSICFANVEVSFVTSDPTISLRDMSKSTALFNSAVNGLLLGNSIDQWLNAGFILLLGWLIGKTISWAGSSFLTRLAARSDNRMDDALVEALRRPVVTLITVLSFVAGYKQLDVPGRLDLWMDRVFHVAIALSLTWAVVRALDAMLKTYLRDRASDPEGAERNQFLPAVRSSIKALLWALGIVAALNNAGYDVGALLAGIGIGGLAMALAAKDTLANIFGGITVFTDKPFSAGERVRIGGYDGIVEEIGIRSTRLRTMDGPVVVIPNHKFTESILENVSQEGSRRVRHELNLEAQTGKAELQQAISMLALLVQDHQLVLEEEHGAHLSGFKDGALQLVFVYHIRKSAPLLATQNEVNMDLLMRFRAAGILFAKPATA